MLSEEVKSVSLALGALAGTVPEEAWEVIRQCRRNLQAAALAARQMEEGLCLPDPSGSLEVPQ